MGSFGLPEMAMIVVVGFIVFVVLGPKNLPKLGKMLGSTVKEVRQGMAEATEAMNDVASDEPAAPAAPASEATSEDIEIDPNRKVAKIIYEDEE